VARLAQRAVETDQRAAHGFAWVATSVAALEAVSHWLDSNDGGTQLDQHIASLIFAETLGQLTGGLPMGQNEIFRPVDLGISTAAQSLAQDCTFWLDSDQAKTRAAVAQALADGQMPSETLHDAESGRAADHECPFDC
jgi:(2S)-methylsuccinyl-CoA dehydrogenase